MSIATQITRINTAKSYIKEVVNQDFDKIQNETITYYPDKIAETIEEYKKYIPENMVKGTELNINDAAPIFGKIAIKGNIYQDENPTPDTPKQIKILTGNNIIKHSNNNGTIREYQLNLGNIELCRIGDYKDELFKNVVGDENYNAELEVGAWYKKNVVGKIILDGTENGWGKSSISGATITSRFRCSNILNQAISNLAVCNMFINRTGSMTAGDYQCVLISQNYNVYISINIDLLSEDSVAAFKAYLANNNITLYYVFATPTYEKITDQTLISQLEALRKFKWFKGVNHIWTETNNLEPILEGTYKQDMIQSGVA